jgi:DNA-binding SARP family transcriptional activator
LALLRLTTFGGLSLSRDGQPLSGAAAQRSRLALLALLASAGPAGISRDKVLLYLWPESDTERARHALKQAVYALRRDLGDEDAIVGTSSLSLNPTLFESDLRDFESAIARGDYPAAIATYTGPFLDGVYLKDAPEFERWCAEQRVRHAQSWAHAVEELAKGAERTGEWREAVNRWRQLAANEPLSGRVTQSLMRALAESGDTAAALQQYRIHESLVREEMGGSPESEVVAFADALKSGKWQKSPPVVVATRPTPVASPYFPGAATPLSTPAIDPSPAPELAVVTPGVARTRRRKWTLIAVGAVALLLVSALVFYYVKVPANLRPALTARAAASAIPNSIVIAPLDDNSGDSTLAKFGELAHATLIGELSNNGFKVFDDMTTKASVGVVDSIQGILRWGIFAIWIVLGVLLAAYLFGVRAARRGWFSTFRSRYAQSFNLLTALAGIAWLGAGVAAARPGASESTIASQRESSPSRRAAAIAEYTGADQVLLGSYHLTGDTLKASVRITNVATNQVGPAISAAGPKDHPEAVLQALATRTLVAFAGSTDQRPSAWTTSLVVPPSLVAFDYVTRGWKAFFDDPADTITVFDLFARAQAADTSYLMPRFLKGYIYDVKRQWPATQRIVDSLKPRRERLGLVERTALEMYEADLRGKGYDRLRAATRLMELSPRSSEMVLLVTLSWLYVGRPGDAAAALDQTDENFGINLFTPVYWEWRTGTEHAAGNYSAEARSAKMGRKRFSNAVSMTEAKLRVLATQGEINGILRMMEGDEPGMREATSRRELGLFAARELRAHDHVAESRQVLDKLKSELATVAMSAESALLWHKGEVLHELGDFAEARAVFATLMGRDSSDIHAAGRYGAASARLADTTEARRIDAHLASLKTPYLMGWNTAWRAHIAAASGRLQEAGTLLESAAREGFRVIDLEPWHPHDDGDFAEFRKSGGYDRLLTKLAEYPF